MFFKVIGARKELRKIKKYMTFLQNHDAFVLILQNTFYVRIFGKPRYVKMTTQEFLKFNTASYTKAFYNYIQLNF